LPSEYAAARSGSSSNDEFPRPNGLRKTAKTPSLRRGCCAFLLALACCLPLVAASALGGTYPATDSFSGSGALSSNWTNTTSSGQGYVPLTQNIGTVAPSVSGQQGLAIYSGVTFTNDQYAQAKFVNHSSAAGSTGVCVRMNAAGSGVCYLADWGLIYSLSNGAGSYSITSGCPVPASGDTIQLLVVGTTYTCKDLTTGASRSAIDTRYSTGDPAILVDQRNSTVYALAQFQADCSPSCGSGSSTPPPPTTSYPAVDTFSGSGALSASWTNTTSSGQGYVALAQNTGTVAPSTSGQQGLAIYTGVTFTNDQYAQARFVNHSSAGGSTGVCVRMNAAGNGVCYLADWGLIYSLANGAGSYPITQGCPVPASGDTIQLLVVGTTYTCTDITTGASRSATDTRYSTGTPAILVDQRNSTIYALAQFQADCSPSCGSGSSTPPPPTTTPQLTVSTTSLSFGSVAVNLAATQSVTLTSSGTSAVTVNSASITGAGFSIVGGTLPTTLNPSQSMTLQVQFLPTTTGSSTGNLTISSNSTTGSTAVVSLSGTGMSASIYPVADTFSGSGALSSNWTNTTSSGQGYVPLAQNTGTVAPSVSGQQGLAIYTGVSFTNDQYSQARFVNHSSAGGSTGVCVRMNAAGNGVCYLADWGLIYSLANGAGSYPITQGCPVPASGDTIQLLVVGTTYTCKDVTTGASRSATDTKYSTGDPAILVDQRNSTIYALAQFQADCSPSCASGSPPPPPTTTPQLTVSTTSLSFGSVTVNSATTLSVTLTSSGTGPVTVNSASIAGAGFSIVAATLPETLNPGQSLTVQIQFLPTAAGSATGSFTISSNSTTGSTAVVSLGGTGTAAVAHEVDLSWSPPSSSTDPVAGYHIYRSTGSGTAVLINSSMDTLTTYADTTVVSGMTYSYLVKSVDSAGVESTPSNEITVTIP
jgi:Abnormal spindle-like microcephaly-assoc'd, ASPM-SPD-2-Hydin